jgi:hypothetical protein
MIDYDKLRKIIREELHLELNESPTQNLEREAIASAIRDICDDLDAGDFKSYNDAAGHLRALAHDAEFGQFEPLEKEDVNVYLEDFGTVFKMDDVLKWLDVGHRVCMERGEREHAVFVSRMIYQGDTRE